MHKHETAREGEERERQDARGVVVTKEAEREMYRETHTQRGSVLSR